MAGREMQFKGPSSRDHDRKNPRNELNLGLQLKPGEGNPKANIKQSHQRKANLEKRRKEKQEQEQSKLDRIEAKIENARKRLEEKKKLKSQNAKNTIIKKQEKGNKYFDSDDDLEEYRVKNTRMQVGNRFKSQNEIQQNTRSHKTLVGNKFSPQKSGGKGEDFLEQHHESQQINLDNDGTSQFTYPMNRPQHQHQLSPGKQHSHHVGYSNNPSVQ
jgi:hypothetical protein